MENKILIDSVNNLKVALNEISVYDFDVYTSMELYYKIAENFNKVIKELNRFEGVVSDEIIKQNEKLLYLLGDGLKIEVVDKINEMVETGVFDTIINLNIFNNLKEDIKNVSSQLEHKANKGYFLRYSKDSYINTELYTVSDYYTLYDSLVNDKFSSINLGKDQSGTYDIRLYRYIPTSYNKTLFITCAIHGWEHYGTYIMYEIFKTLLNDSGLPPQLSNLRNTRILCIPIANPWGLMAGTPGVASSERRGNSRGVDLNRNFDYNWDANTGAFGLSKGDSAFSEIETQYIKNVMKTYNITHYLDLHSFDGTGDDRDYLFYGNPESQSNTNEIISWLNKQYSDLNIQHTISENDSSANNYANRILRIPSMNIELIKKSNDYNKWYELLLNFLKLQCESYTRINYNDVGCKFIQREPQNALNVEIPIEWGNVNELSLEIEDNINGLFMVNGFMVLKVENSDSSTIFNFSPKISQKNLYIANNVDSRAKAYINGFNNGSIYVPFSASLPIKKGFGKITFDMEVLKEGNGTLTLHRCDATYNFIPCEHNFIQASQHTKID